MKFDFLSIPKVCISLVRSKERRERVSAQFKRFNLSVPFFDAIDKNNIIVPELSVKLNHQPKNAPGVLACVLSHIAVFKKSDKLNLPAICVFEDDIILSSIFGEQIERIQNNYIDFDVFILGGHHPSKDWNGKTAYPTKDEGIYKITRMNGTYAYCITRPVYQYFIRNWNYNFGCDEFFSEKIYSNFNTYAMSPFPVGTEPNKSDITDSLFDYDANKYFAG